MKGSVFVNGVIGVDCSLIDVIRQVKSFKKPTELSVVINSVGGSVSEGQAIFTYLRNLNIPITTTAEQAYSIASVIFMAGDTRIVPEGDRRLMIHNPWASVEGGADRLEDIAGKLREIEEQFSDFYSTYANIDKETMKSLLKNETFLSGAEALEMGFATELSVPLAAVALLGDVLETEIEKEMSIGDKFYSELKKLMNIMEKQKDEIKALILQDANGVEINFPEVEDGSTPEIGDMATVDSLPAEGEYTAPSGDVWIFEGGALKEVKTADAPEEEVPADAEGDKSADTVQLKELLDKLLGLEASFTASAEKAALVDAELLALKDSFNALKETTAEIDTIKAGLADLRKLVGSEEVTIVAKETKTNQKKSSGLINVFR